MSRLPTSVYRIVASGVRPRHVGMAIAMPLFLLGRDVLHPIAPSSTVRPPGTLISQSHPDSDSHKGHSGVQMIEITKAGGSLIQQLKRQADSAAAHGQVVLVDVGTVGCVRCIVFKKSLVDPIMVTSLKKARLIYVDFDVWSHELINNAYLDSYYLPEFFLLKADGKKGDAFDKGRWQDYADSAHVPDGAQMMGPPLEEFVAAHLNK